MLLQNFCAALALAVRYHFDQPRKMPKAPRNRSDKADAQQGKAKSFIGAGKSSFDPALTSLFASSVCIHSFGTFRTTSRSTEKLTVEVVRAGYSSP